MGMARVRYLTRDDMSPENRDLLDDTAIHIRRAMVNSPNCARVQSRMMQYIRHNSRLDSRLRELAILQVGFTTRNQYEWVQHVEQALLAGCSPEDIRAITEDSAGRPSHLEPLARAVLQASRELTSDVDVSDATYEALKAALDDECMVDLMVAISFYNATVRLLAALRVDVEDDKMHILRDFPLPA
jgi:alkylhydroperoxidase family enzyme